MEGTVPPLPGEVGKFISSPEWRDYLVQVPGASQAFIDDAALARLMNWIVRRFDPRERKGPEALRGSRSGATAPSTGNQPDRGAPANHRRGTALVC